MPEMVSIYPFHERLRVRPTSGKSTQKAFMFKPYKKLAKFSLNLDKLSCISCRCIKFASRSAIESDSSAKAGSRNCKGNSEEGLVLPMPADSLKDVREAERNGVVGREGGREADLLALVGSIEAGVGGEPT